jgi:hypothetical protein
MSPLLFYLGLVTHTTWSLCAIKRFLWCSVALELEIEFGRFHFLCSYENLLFYKWKGLLKKITFFFVCSNFVLRCWKAQYKTWHVNTGEGVCVVWWGEVFGPIANYMRAIGTRWWDVIRICLETLRFFWIIGVEVCNHMAPLTIMLTI